MSDDLNGGWSEVGTSDEAQVLQMMRDYIQSKVADINQQILDLTHKRSSFHDMSSFVHDLQKVRGYDEPKS